MKPMKVTQRGLAIASLVPLVALLTLPWSIQAAQVIRLEWRARSLTDADTTALLASPRIAPGTTEPEPEPVISRMGSSPGQRGIVRFRNGGHVRFAFSGHPGTAVFVGDGCHRIVSSKGWCCEVQLPVIEDLAHLNRLLDRMQDS